MMIENRKLSLIQAYNNQYNELVKLHKFLVECPLSPHSIDVGNPIDDAITLMKQLIKEKNSGKASS